MNEILMSNETINYREYIAEKLESLTYNSDPHGTMHEFMSFLDQNYERMNTFERAELYYLIASYHYLMNNIKESRSYAEKALFHIDFENDIDDILRYKLLKARIYNTIAITYSKEGKIFQSAEDFTRSFENSIFCNDLILENQVLNNIGDIYLSVGAHSQAIEMFERVENRNVERNYNKQVDYVLSSLFVYLNLGTCYTNIGRLDKAKQYLKRVDNLIKASDNPIFFLYRQDLKRCILEAEGDYEKSDEIGLMFIDKFLNTEEGIVLCDEMLSYLRDLSLRPEPDLVHLKSRLEKIKNYIETKGTDSQRILFSTTYFNVLIGLGEKSAVKDYMPIYEDVVSGILENFDRERGMAVIEQYESLLIRHEHISVDENQMIAEFYRHSVQKEKEEYKRDYEKLKLINSVARAARNSRDLKLNLLKIMAAYRESLPLSRIHLWVVSCDDTERYTHYLVKKSDDVVKEEVCQLPQLPSLVLEMMQNSSLSNYSGMEDMDFGRDEEGGLTTGSEAGHSTYYLRLELNTVVMGVIAYQMEEDEELTQELKDVLRSATDFITLGIFSFKKSRTIEWESRNQEELRKELEGVNVKLKAIIDRDGLTGIPNRRYFESKYPYISRLALNEDSKLAIFIVDIDDFKAYNDSKGHLEGDEILKRVARAMYDSFPKEKAVFARYGGEEFYGMAVMDDENLVKQVARALVEAVRNLGIAHEGSSHGMITVSVGAVFCTVISVNDLERQIAYADELLYRAKSSGKNSYEFDYIENIIMIK